MPRRGPLYKARQIRNVTTDFSMITVGKVVDTNDPQQMGRLRVACPLLGDLGNSTLEDIPWSSYMSPFGGTTTTPARGREEVQTPGQLAYGMFNIPKVGSSVLVMCIDGDPRFRIWMGCLHEQFLTHTMPHGRYSYATENLPDGPFSSSEDKIQPLYDSQTQAFTKAATAIPDSTTEEPRKSFEFRTRGADTSVSGLGEDFVNNEDSQISFLADDVEQTYTEDDGIERTNTQGYQKTRVEPGLKSDTTGGDSYDPQVHSWTTPGFHSMSMSDNAKNCRVRFRTTHGHQIIMDDTNERIYVSTAGGKCWIEMDEAGNIDVYAERNLSFHAEKDINFTTEQSFRVKAKEGIHMVAEGEMRLHAKGLTDGNPDPTKNMHIKIDNSLFLEAMTDVSIEAVDGQLNLKSETKTEIHVNAGQLYAKASSDVEVKSGANVKVEAAAAMDLKSVSDLTIESDANAHLKAATNANVEGAASANLKSAGAANVDGGAGANILGNGANVLLTGAQVHLNGPPAGPAGPADSADAATGADGVVESDDTLFHESFWTSRVPEHEPWARTMTSSEPKDGFQGTDNPIDNDHVPELNYIDKDVGRKERTEVITRNEKWHR